MVFRFGRYELDEEAGELRRDGAPIAIQPKPFALLQHLIRERQRVVTLDELYQLLWPDVAVTPSSLTRAVSVARSAIGDTGRGDMLCSVARRGYRFAADVVAIEASRTPAGRARRAPAEAARDPFIGRDDALAALRAAWTEAAKGRGAIALVTGAPGIGKTRLCEELAREAEAAGARLLVGRAREGEGVPALWIWAQVLRQIAALPAGRQRESLGVAAGALVELAPELATGLPRAERASAARSPEQSQFLLFEAVSGVLTQLASERPVVLFLEDLQWAGTTSLRVLEHLAYEIATAPLLVLATARSEPRPHDHPVERALALMRQQRRLQEITLRGFSRREVAQLVEHALGRPAPPDLSSELVARTEGVPLLLREALRLLAERGDLRHPESVRRWAVSLPIHAVDLIQRPLEPLSAPCAELLAAGAVLGREWTLPLVAAVAGVAREAALDLVDEATAAGVVETAPGQAATWRFSHALFQEAVYGRLSASARVRLHARAAEELERRHGADLEHVIAELAHHRHESLAVGDPERAFACAVEAAEHAKRVLSFEQAATHYEQALAALEHAEPVDAERRLATLLDLGEALRLDGDRERRRSVLDRAMGEARGLERPLCFARAAVGYCDLGEWAPADDEALVRLEEALAGLPEAASHERAQVMTRIAYLLARQRPDRAQPIARRAVELARLLGDSEVRQDAIYGLHFLLSGPDHLDERESLAREIVEAASDGPVRDATIIAVLDDASDHLLVGDADGARRQRALAGEIAGHTPSPARRWNMLVYDAGIAVMEGRIEDAERMAGEVAVLGGRIQHPYARGVPRMLRVMLARHRGDEAEVVRRFAPTGPQRYGPVHWVRAYGARALVAIGRSAEARAILDELAAERFDAIPRNIRWSVTMIEIANLCADLDDVERAEPLAALLGPAAHHHGVLPLTISYCGPASRALARLAALCGRPEEADERFDEAIDACASVGAVPMQARALLEHGALLARRGQARRAREQTERGRALARSVGLAESAAGS